MPDITVHKDVKPRFGFCECCNQKRVIHLVTLFDMTTECCRSCIEAYREGYAELLRGNVPSE